MKQKTISLDNPSPKIFKAIKIVIEAIVAILIVVWLHTGISKLIEYKAFRIQMFQSQLFHNYAAFITFAAPILEIIIAAMLIFKKTRMLGMIGSFLLMIFFTWYVIYLMIYVPNLPCSCGGIVSFLTWPQHLALNIFLTLLSLTGIILIRKQHQHPI